MKKLLALASTDRHLSLLGTIAERFSPFFTLDCRCDWPASPSAYDGQLVLDQAPMPGLASYQLPVDLDLNQLTTNQLMQLTWDISQFVASLDQLPLDQLPLHVALTNRDNQITYHNDRPKDPFLPLDLDPEPVPDWVLQAIQTTDDHAVHLLLPSISFDQILIQSYQGLYDQGQFSGVFQQVQDIKPLLANYLKETGQALVGWSDTVSGASIKNSLFDDFDDVD